MICVSTDEFMIIRSADECNQPEMKGQHCGDMRHVTGDLCYVTGDLCYVTGAERKCDIITGAPVQVVWAKLRREFVASCNIEVPVDASVIFYCFISIIGKNSIAVVQSAVCYILDLK